MTDPVVVSSGPLDVQLPGGQVVHIDTNRLTLDQLRRLERALAEVDDPTGRYVHMVELHPIVGEWARAVVHLHREPALDSVAVEVSA